MVPFCAAGPGEGWASVEAGRDNEVLHVLGCWFLWGTLMGHLLACLQNGL